MTRLRRPIPAFPTIHGDAYAIGRTVYGGPGQTLAEAANSACLDFLAQRLTIPRTTGGTFHLFYRPSSVARYLWLSPVVTKVGTWTPLDGATFDVAITDGTSTVTSSDSRIPDGLKADRTLSAGGFRRWEAGVGEWFLDLDALASGSPALNRTVPWRVTVAIVCGSTAQVECLAASEVPRWWVDSTQSYGVLPGSILPRSIVEDDAQTERLVATLETAHSLPRTYLSITRAEAATATHLTATATSFASIAGWEEAAGTSLTHTVRAQRLLAAGTGTSGIRCKARCRYKINGTSATLRVITGAGSYDLSLSDTSGAWTDSGDLTAYLKTSGADQIDTIQLQSKLAAGGPTLSIDALGLWGDP